MSEPSPSESSGLVSLADEQRVAELIGQSLRGRWEVVDTLNPPAAVHQPLGCRPVFMVGLAVAGRRDRPR